MNPKLKAAWAWLAGILGPPLLILTPYLSEWNFHLPNEVKGALVLSVLGGLGLVNMIPPKQHTDDEGKQP